MFIFADPYLKSQKLMIWIPWPYIPISANLILVVEISSMTILINIHLWIDECEFWVFLVFENFGFIFTKFIPLFFFALKNSITYYQMSLNCKWQLQTVSINLEYFFIFMSPNSLDNSLNWTTKLSQDMMQNERVKIFMTTKESKE